MIKKTLQNRLSLIVGLCLISTILYSQESKTLIFHEKFNTMNDWVVEQVEGGEVSINNGKLDLNDFSGCSVWFKKELEAPFIITYKARVINKGGSNDRVSDLNCFWLAKDMDSPGDFFKNSDNRGGEFANYHNLRLYYVGLGGHNNTKTRFRKYDGTGQRPLLPEHDLSDKKYLINANKTNRIKIVVDENKVQYFFNGLLVYDIIDPVPYKKGYFGFRTYKNHMWIDDFKVYKIAN